MPNYFEYDIIVVSSRYADLARQTQGGGNIDFLDRFFTPVPLYDSDPQLSRFTNKIGTAGFRKVWFPKTPQEYVLELRSGKLPSISAIQVCIAMHKDHRAYCDLNTTFMIMTAIG